MTTRETTGPEAAGATLHLGGAAWCTPDLAPLLVPIDQLTPFPGNARRGDQDAITSSVRDLGVWRAHVVQQSTGHVMVGNHQLRALLDLGATHAPASYRDTTDDLARAIALRDNRTSDLGSYDDAGLLTLLRLAEEDGSLPLTGMDTDDMDALARAVANLEFTQGALPDGTPLGDVSQPIDVDGDTARVTVTVDTGHRSALYELLAKQPWVRDVADAHVRKPA